MTNLNYLKPYADASVERQSSDVMRIMYCYVSARRVLIYNGQLDVIIAWPLTESFITSMKWSGAEDYLKARRTKWYKEMHKFIQHNLEIKTYFSTSKKLNVRRLIQTSNF